MPGVFFLLYYFLVVPSWFFFFIWIPCISRVSWLPPCQLPPLWPQSHTYSPILQAPYHHHSYPPKAQLTAWLTCLKSFGPSFPLTTGKNLSWHNWPSHPTSFLSFLCTLCSCRKWPPAISLIATSLMFHTPCLCSPSHLQAYLPSSPHATPSLTWGLCSHDRLLGNLCLPPGGRYSSLWDPLCVPLLEHLNCLHSLSLLLSQDAQHSWIYQPPPSSKLQQQCVCCY